MTLNLYSWEKSLVDQALGSKLLNAPRKFGRGEIEPMLTTAYETCEAVTKQNSRSFSMASGFLPPEKRQAVRALYAFCRYTDDIVDLEQEGQARILQEWRDRTSRSTFITDDAIATAWLDTRIRHRIPQNYIEHFLDGVARDLYKSTYDTFDELAQYCYGVASTVGLMSMFIIGFSGEEAVPYAIRLGVALQLTNILRDIAEDWDRGRIYLPAEELTRFGLSHKDLNEGFRTGKYGDNWREFMKFQIERTRRLYAEAWPGIGMLHPEGRFAIAAAADLYAGILDDIEAHDYDVFTRRAHVSDWKKLSGLPRILKKVRRLPPYAQ